MNLKRAIVGPLLSIVFLVFFAYMISGVQWVFDDFLPNQINGAFLGAVSYNNVVVQNNNETPSLNISSQAAISVWTNPSRPEGYPSKVLFSENEDRKLPIASISKLMTALVVLENSDLSQEIKISDEATSQSIDPELLKPGETFFTKDLLSAMLIGSDNAASYALSEGTEGNFGKDKFIDLMNARAKELGLFNTSFLNPSGLGLKNFSTAQDLAKLAEYIFKNYPSILQITTIPQFDLYASDGKILHKIVNTDELLKNSSGLSERIIGGKTGTTRTAGGCFLLVAETLNNNGYLINVILNSSDKFEEMKKIINWADTVQK